MRRRIRRLATPAQPSLPSRMEWQSPMQQEALQKQDDPLDVVSSLKGGPSLQAQLERADRLGHHFSRVSVLSSTPQIMGRGETGESFLQRMGALDATSRLMRDANAGQQSGETGSASEALENQLTQSKGSGSTLSEQTRSYMEPRFGADFGGVRIHTGQDAVQMCRSMNAQAFTHGNDVFFNSGKYDPGSMQGKELLAHELTHVLQQGSANQVSMKAMDETSTQPDQERGQDTRRDERETAAQEKRQQDQQGQESEVQIEDEIDRIAMEYLPPRNVFVKEDLRGMYNDTPNVRGDEGDCYELSKMRIAAQKDPEGVKNRTQDNGDGTFNVTIYLQDPTTGKKVPTTKMVDGVLPVGQPGRDFFSDEQMVSPPEPEFWAMLVEKAYAMHFRGDGQVEGGTIARSMQMLTGGSSEYLLDRFSDRQITSMLSYATKNRARVMATSQNFEHKSQSTKDEAAARGLPTFSRSNFEIKRANGSILIYNPYGPTLEISVERFKRFFISFSVK